jgi:hypothetical protein
VIPIGIKRSLPTGNGTGSPDSGKTLLQTKWEKAKKERERQTTTKKKAMYDENSEISR